MTPKEKARDLINKFSLKVLDTHLGGSNVRVIECALLAVNEILIALEKYPWENINLIEYYTEVKKELEKLKN